MQYAKLIMFSLNETNYKITTSRHMIKFQFDSLRRSVFEGQYFFELTTCCVIRESCESNILSGI